MNLNKILALMTPVAESKTIKFAYYDTEGNLTNYVDDYRTVKIPDGAVQLTNDQFYAERGNFICVNGVAVAASDQEKADRQAAAKAAEAAALKAQLGL